MASGLQKLLVAGALSAVATASFADNRANAQVPAPAATATTQAAPAQDAIPAVNAFTKDGKALKISVNLPILNRGAYSNDAQFNRALAGGVMMSTLTTLTQYTEADIPKNIDKIQQQITAGIGAMVPLGTVKDGKSEFAKPGVNYGNITLTHIEEATGGKVILDQKPPAAAKPAPAPKGPGAKA